VTTMAWVPSLFRIIGDTEMVNLFNLIGRIFTLFHKDPEYRYAVFLNNEEIAKTVTLPEAEAHIRELFNSVDDKFRGGRQFGTYMGLSKNKRWKSFRGKFKIKKILHDKK
jgi:hypothetical protein